MKLGDKVISNKFPGRIFDLVRYQEGDTTCAIQDEKLRVVVKVSTLDLVPQE
jgi:hypothetical protein